MKVKRYMRILGIDDAPFNKFKDKGKNVLVVGTIFRGGDFLDGLISTKVRVDGRNATKKLIEMINKSKFKPQLRVVMLDGIALGGFNIVDIEELWKATGIPVMVVMRKYPDFAEMFHALDKLGMGWKKKLIEKAGEPERFGRLYVQSKGLKKEQINEILKLCCKRSIIPEPIRVAHIIASGIVLGESRGGA
ncbi:hypothetical protein DRJ16_03955 [Candidatus Woesearchaeota archaeon]|nr:MAG: hypothetical protein DRJ16_03955 [Candidatus Woesearchaeota archaeon]